jgi:hypothetical protein
LSRLDSEAPKTDGAPIWRATDRTQGGDAPTFFSEKALLRLEEGLRDQREPPVRSDQPPKPDGATGLRRNSEGRRFSESDALLCVLLLVVAAVGLGDWLKARTAGSSDAALVNIEAPGRTASVAPDNDEPRQPITNVVKSSADTSWLPPLSPSPPNEQPVEAQGPAAPGASETVGVAVKRDRTKPRARVRQAGLFAHRRVAETEELQQIHASIRRPIQYGRCWLNNYQTYYHWGECLR